MSKKIITTTYMVQKFKEEKTRQEKALKEVNNPNFEMYYKGGIETMDFVLKMLSLAIDIED